MCFLGPQTTNPNAKQIQDTAEYFIWDVRMKTTSPSSRQLQPTDLRNWEERQWKTTSVRTHRAHPIHSRDLLPSDPCSTQQSFSGTDTIHPDSKSSSEQQLLCSHHLPWSNSLSGLILLPQEAHGVHGITGTSGSSLLPVPTAEHSRQDHGPHSEKNLWGAGAFPQREMPCFVSLLLDA